MRSTSSPFAVSMMMGNRVLPAAQPPQTTSRPRPGSIRSSTSRSTRSRPEQLVHARRIRYGMHAEPLLGQIALQQVAQAQIVVDNKDFRLRSVIGGVSYRRAPRFAARP